MLQRDQVEYTEPQTMTNQQRKARLGELQRAFAAQNIPVCIVF